MKKGILIAAGAVALLALGMGAWLYFNRLERRLVGTWRDENSLVQYRANGTKIAKYDFGVTMRGRWYLVGQDVIFTSDDARWPDPNRQTIVKLTRDELVIRSDQDWHAKRVPDEEMTKALKGAGM